MCFASGKTAYSSEANNGDTHDSCSTFNSAVRMDKHFTRCICSANVRPSPDGSRFSWASRAWAPFSNPSSITHTVSLRVGYSILYSDCVSPAVHPFAS